MKNSIIAKPITKDRFSGFSAFPILAVMIALLVGAVIGIFDPSIWEVVVGAIIMAVIIIFRQDELAATAVIIISLYYDWYLKQGWVLAQIMALVLLLIFFLARSSRYPWAEPPALWLWILLLILAIFPMLRGISLNDGIYYYSNIIFGAFVMFWLGIVIGRDIATVRHFLRALSAFGTLVAVHTIIQVTTGVFLFKTTVYDSYLAFVVSNYQLGDSGVNRIGSFLINPDAAGGFFAMMFVISLGLFTESSSFLEKFLYIVEMILTLLALLFTYSTGGWIPALIAFLVFLLFVGRTYYRILLPLVASGIAIAITIFFPSQVNLLLQHVTQPLGLQLRVAAWLTGIQVIRGFPLLGIGLGRYDYIVRAYPYRVDPYHALALYKIPLYHPQNSYLELAALGGLPIAIILLVLLSTAFWLALRNWAQSDARTRSLLAGGIATVVALSVNSLSNTGWTLPPLAATGWMILGIISSPLLRKSLDSERKNSKASNS